jgi:hypothetical protein
MSLRRELKHKLVDFMLGRDINAPRHVIEKQDLAFREKPSPEQHLLLVAAGECADGLVDARRTHAQAVDDALSRAPLLGRLQHAEAREALEDDERCVVTHAHPQQQALGLAVLGHQRHARGDRGLR